MSNRHGDIKPELGYTAVVEARGVDGPMPCGPLHRFAPTACNNSLTCTITASQAGHSGWNPALDVTRSFQITPAPDPAPVPAATTALTVEAPAKSKRLRSGKRTKTVRSTTTNGKLKKVRVLCYLPGKMLTGTTRSVPARSRHGRFGPPTVGPRFGPDQPAVLGSRFASRSQRKPPALTRRNGSAPGGSRTSPRPGAP